MWCSLQKIAVWFLTISSLIGFLYGIKMIEKMVTAEVKMAEATTVILRPLTEKEILQLYLYEQVGYNVKDYNILKRIITCESQWDIMAYNSKSNDYGLFQINQRYWEKKAKELGLENYKDDWKENIQLGVWIYKNSGLFNWNWSKSCWK